MKIELSHSLKDIQDQLTQLQQKHLKTAHERALKKTLTSAGVVAKDIIKAKYKLPPRVLKPRIKGKVSEDGSTGVLWIGLAPVAVEKLGTPKQNAQGTRVAGQTYDHAFIATMKSGHRGVYRRQTKARLPIESVKLRLDDAESVLKETLEEKGLEFYEHYLKQTLDHLTKK